MHWSDKYSSFLADQPRSVRRHGRGGDALEVVATRGAAHAAVAPAAVAVAVAALAVEDVAFEFLPPLLDGFRRQSKGEDKSETD